jgi:hypothetical protein
MSVASGEYDKQEDPSEVRVVSKKKKQQAKKADLS